MRALALSVACEIHPLNNLRVLRYLTGRMGLSEQQKDIWYRHWVTLGLQAMQQQLAHDSATGRFCHGDRVGLADVCLIPQLANARRFKIDLSGFPTLTTIESHCMELEAFQAAAPAAQADAE